MRFFKPFFLFVSLGVYSSLGVCAALQAAQGASAVGAAPAAAVWPAYSAAEDMGVPLPTTQVIHSVVTEENGVPVLAVTVSGDPARLNIFDLENDRVLRSLDVPKGKTFWIHGKDSAGDVFFAGYTDATLYQYSVKDGTLKEIGRLEGEQAACAITFDDEDNVYVGTYPNAKVFKFDRKSGKLLDLGRKLENEKYFKSLVYHEGYLYGGGMKPDPDFVRIDLRTMQPEPLPKVGDGRVTSYYYGSKARDLLFMDAITGGGKRSVFIYDMKAGKWLDQEFPEGMGLVATPEIDGKVYFTATGGVWEFDLETRDARRVIERYRAGFRGGGVVSLKGDERFATPSYVNLLYGGGIAIYNFKTGEQKRYSSRLDSAAGVISALSHSGDDLLIGEFMGPRLQLRAPQGGREPVTIPMAQSESIREYRGKIYVGTYPGATVTVYDPQQPLKRDSNPRVLFNLKEQGQSRPYGLTFSGSRLVVGMTADYGLTQGALAVYDLDSGKLDTFKNILPELNFTALTQKDGTVWGSTTVYGGLGSEPVASEAQIFSFDPVAGKIIRAVSPKLPGVSQLVKAWGALTVGPDGLLWGIAYGTVAAFDPQTLQVVKSAEIVPINWSEQDRSWAHYSLEFTQEGFLVANPGQRLIILNPADMQWRDLLPTQQNRRIGPVTITANGDIYFIRLNESSRLLRLVRQ